MLPRLKLTIIAFVLGVGLHALPVRAAFVPTADIDRTVAEFLTQQGLSVRARPVDPRLKLGACETPLDITPQDTNRSLSVRCNDADGWRIFVPLMEAAPALAAPDAPRPLVVALKTSLPRGALVTAKDVDLIPAPSAINSGMLREAEAAVGHKLLRSVNAGTPLKLTMLERAPAVRRGDRVVLRASGKGFSVQVEGIAKEDGAEGDRVTAVNLSSGEKLAGRIDSDGALLISF
jgi:flagella basal body P-ring formation protein FlgA|tara:strand:+ start:16235 stop:16933 length:699 start_codon:yes stop_codon:yes gene_type:complete